MAAGSPSGPERASAAVGRRGGPGAAARGSPQGRREAADVCTVAAPSFEDAHVVATSTVGPTAGLDLAALRANPLHAAEAEREVLRRSVASTVALLVVYVAMQLAFDAGGATELRVFSAGMLGVSVAVRVWAIRHERRGRPQVRLRRTLFFLSAIGIALAWGLTEAGHLAMYGTTLHMMVITTNISGFAMGVMVTFAPWRRLQLASLVSLLLPVPIFELSRGEFGTWGLIHLAYLLYTAWQGRVLLRDYWRAIGTSDLLARHAESLREANAERKQLQENLRFAERMASLGTLAAGVAHEINNPMTYVLGNLEYIAEELQQRPSPAWGEADPGLEQLVAEATDGARRVVRIVRDLKTFSRHSEDDPLAPVALEGTLDTAADMARAQIRHRARLERDYRGSTMVLGDIVRLGQVFLNLVVNAAQAIPEGEDQEQHRIVLRTYVDASGMAVAEVEDSGTGIDPEHMPRLFDPFFTTKPVGIGTGLGLSSAMGIVSALGGKIDVESKLGCGTTVRVRLPRLTNDRQLLKAG